VDLEVFQEINKERKGVEVKSRVSEISFITPLGQRKLHIAQTTNSKHGKTGHSNWQSVMLEASWQFHPGKRSFEDLVVTQLELISPMGPLNSPKALAICPLQFTHEVGRFGRIQFG